MLATVLCPMLFAWGGGPGGATADPWAGASAADDDARRFAPMNRVYGYSMQEEWATLWRRILDRHGRADEMGPLYQPRIDLDRREYPLTLAVADFPMRWERDWAVRNRGARFWMHSDDEFFFLNRVQIKEQVPMGRVGAMGFRYDRVEGRTVQSSLFRLDFRFPDIRDTGAFVELRGYLRAAKPDLDLEAVVGQDFAWGRVMARGIVFDPIVNASDALVKARNGEVERRLHQENLAFGWSLEAQTRSWHGLRAEGYLGNVVPNRLRVEYADFAPDPEGDFYKEQSGILGGGLLEYGRGWRGGARKKRYRMHVGAGTTLIATEHRVDFDDFERADIDAPERRAEVKLWWLAHFPHDIDAQVMGRYTRSKLGLVPGLDYRRADLDRQWFAEARATWMFTRPFGMELGYSILERRIEGDERLQPIAGLDNRALVRFVLRLQNWFWCSFGAGFDLDRGNEPYDQAGMTMILRW